MNGSFHTGEVLVLVFLQGICFRNSFVNFAVVGRQISHCNRLRMCCRIGSNRYIVAVYLAVICRNFNGMGSRRQAHRAVNLLSVHFHNNIGQTVWCYKERNRIESLRYKMNIFIEREVFGSAWKQVDFCFFSVYSFRIR